MLTVHRGGAEQEYEVSPADLVACHDQAEFRTAAAVVSVYHRARVEGRDRSGVVRGRPRFARLCVGVSSVDGRPRTATAHGVTDFGAATRC